MDDKSVLGSMREGGDIEGCAEGQAFRKSMPFVTRVRS